MENVQHMKKNKKNQCFKPEVGFHYLLFQTQFLVLKWSSLKNIPEELWFGGKSTQNTHTKRHFKRKKKIDI